MCWPSAHSYTSVFAAGRIRKRIVAQWNVLLIKKKPKTTHSRKGEQAIKPIIPTPKTALHSKLIISLQVVHDSGI